MGDGWVRVEGGEGWRDDRRARVKWTEKGMVRMGTEFVCVTSLSHWNTHVTFHWLEVQSLRALYHLIWKLAKPNKCMRCTLGSSGGSY